MKSLSALLLVLLLAACGFTPMYGSMGRNADAGLDQVEISLIPDQSGVFLRNVLIDNFYQNGYPSSPRYELQIAPVVETISDLDITVDSESTRRQIKMSSNMVLRDKETGQTVLDSGISAITSYNVLGSQFTTRISESDAREAALTDLARQIETRTALFLKK